MHIAMIGTRGVPAAYGGFETAIEEIGQRLATAGHRVVVYCRGGEPDVEYLGMERVRLGALPVKQAETLSHTCLSVAHLVRQRSRPDVAFVFNAANSPLLRPLRAARVPVALHVDGLEWKRAKWGAGGQRYYRWAEGLGVRRADALVADAPGIADYYRREFGVESDLIRYGAKILESSDDSGVRGLGLEPGAYHLVVARFEPENHVLEAVEGHRRSAARMPLVVVGSAPYAADYTASVEEAAADPRIRLLGGVYDQDLLDSLYFHALTYVHGHSVGGTNPSLLRAVGAATSPIAFDVDFNTEVVGEHGRFFTSADDLARAVEAAEAAPEQRRAWGQAARDDARRRFDWDDVATSYEALAARLAKGASMHPRARRARRRSGT